MQSELLERGLEPDKCYYIQNEPVVRNRDEYDPDVDPPPDLVLDLVLEVDVTSLSTTKLPIYAAFKVPEVWRWVDERLEMFRLDGDKYVLTVVSQCLPDFPCESAVNLLAKRSQLSETNLVAEFRQLIDNDGS